MLPDNNKSGEKRRHAKASWRGQAAALKQKTDDFSEFPLFQRIPIRHPLSCPPSLGATHPPMRRPIRPAVPTASILSASCILSCNPNHPPAPTAPTFLNRHFNGHPGSCHLKSAATASASSTYSWLQTSSCTRISPCSARMDSHAARPTLRSME